MKKLLVLIGITLSLSLSAQTTLTGGGEKKMMGKQGDTLVASDSVSYEITIGDKVFGIMYLSVESDTALSGAGTPAYSVYLYKSQNGKDWGIPVDTISHSGGGNNYDSFDPVNLTSNHYLIAFVSTAASQKSQLYLWARIIEGFIIEQ